MTVTDGGYAKRTALDAWTAKGRGTMGVIAMRIVEERGSLVGALVVHEGDEVLAIASSGVVIRTRVSGDDPRLTGRDTMGVRLMNLAEGDTVVAVARNPEAIVDSDRTDSERTNSDGTVPNADDGMST